MRIFLFFVCFFIGVALHATTPNKLDSLLVHRQFFELQRVLNSDTYRNLPVYRKIYYQAFLHNFFHDLTTSNQEISLLLENYKRQLSHMELRNLLMKKIDNHVKLYQYREAHVTAQLLLRKYRDLLSADEQDDARNSDMIWKGLQDVEPQTTTIVSESEIAYRRDLANLINIPVNFSDSTFDFVFDTGANLSVITESYARKTRLHMLNARFKVKAITGLEVDANLGIAKELKIGNIIVRNVVFMVFPDSALSFAHGAYAIKGIIGFPIIEQLQEVHINKNSLIVPQVVTDRNIRNFGVDELLPVISVVYKTDTLALTFDTGADFTFLYEPFYRRYRSLIDSAGKSFVIQVGGAGGVSKTTAYRLPQVPITIAAQPALLKDVAVKTTHSDPKDKLYYGNLGQDVMNQFKEMVINFRYMYVDFVP